MHKLTVKKYKEFILSLKINKTTEKKLFSFLNLENEDEDIFLNLKEISKTRYLRKVFLNIGENIIPLLKYNECKTNFNLMINDSKGLVGGEKNLFLTKVYKVFKYSEEFTLLKEENQNIFKDLFCFSTILTNKSEEQIITHIILDLFKNNKNYNDLFFKEIFCIYLENIETSMKYNARIDEIKDWARNQNFTCFFDKYKNIKSLFENKAENIYSVSSKIYNLNEVSQKTKTQISWVIQNFNILNTFIEEKIKNNENIKNFIILNEKVHQKILVVYEQRNYIVETVVQMHEKFFAILNQTTTNETEFMNKIWDATILNEKLKSELNINSDKKIKNKV